MDVSLSDIHKETVKSLHERILIKYVCRHSRFKNCFYVTSGGMRLLLELSCRCHRLSCATNFKVFFCELY